MNRPGYAGSTPLNYAKDGIKELLQNVNLRNQSIGMIETQSLRRGDNDDILEENGNTAPLRDALLLKKR